MTRARSKSGPLNNLLVMSLRGRTTRALSLLYGRPPTTVDRRRKHIRRTATMMVSCIISQRFDLLISAASRDTAVENRHSGANEGDAGGNLFNEFPDSSEPYQRAARYESGCLYESWEPETVNRAEDLYTSTHRPVFEFNSAYEDTSACSVQVHSPSSRYSRDTEFEESFDRSQTPGDLDTRRRAEYGIPYPVSDTDDEDTSEGGWRPITERETDRYDIGFRKAHSAPHARIPEEYQGEPVGFSMNRTGKYDKFDMYRADEYDLPSRKASSQAIPGVPGDEAAEAWDDASERNAYHWADSQNVGRVYGADGQSVWGDEAAEYGDAGKMQDLGLEKLALEEEEVVVVDGDDDRRYHDDRRNWQY